MAARPMHSASIIGRQVNRPKAGPSGLPRIGEGLAPHVRTRPRSREVYFILNRLSHSAIWSGVCQTSSVPHHLHRIPVATSWIG